MGMSIYIYEEARGKYQVSSLPYPLEIEPLTEARARPVATKTQQDPAIFMSLLLKELGLYTQDNVLSTTLFLPSEPSP